MHFTDTFENIICDFLIFIVLFLFLLLHPNFSFHCFFKCPFQTGSIEVAGGCGVLDAALDTS